MSCHFTPPPALHAPPPILLTSYLEIATYLYPASSFLMCQASSCRGGLVFYFFGPGQFPERRTEIAPTTWTTTDPPRAIAEPGGKPGPLGVWPGEMLITKLFVCRERK